jgi:hypothetical protein
VLGPHARQAAKRRKASQSNTAGGDEGVGALAPGGYTEMDQGGVSLPRDVIVRPPRHDIRPVPHDDVQVIARHGKAEHVDPELSRQELDAILNPLPPLTHPGLVRT